MNESFSALEPYGFSARVYALWNDRPADLARPGRLVRVDGATGQVACADGTERTCRLRTEAVVGDWVAVTTDDLVGDVLPRWSVLARMDPAQSGAQAGVQVLAANVDVIVIAAPADRLKVARVEREIAFAWESGAQPLVVLTKSDLDDGRLAEQLRQRLVGVDVVPTSVRRRRGLEEVAAVFSAGRTGVLIGPSGAGKSTLLNALVGSEVQATASVREGDQRGRHTTTARHLVCLPNGGVLIDTPGMRSLAIAGGEGIDVAFPDIEELAHRCRFRDCKHHTEPACAVRRAVAEGELDPARLASFEKLVREIAAERRRSDPVAARAARKVWSQRAKDMRRHDKRQWG